MGVFEGKYMNGCKKEFPAARFKNTKLSKTADASLYCFKAPTRQRQALLQWPYNAFI